MSLFQCQHCGCCENTALSSQGFFLTELFDWTGIEDRRGKKLCSACGPAKYSEGKPTKYGKWHEQFDRVFLPMRQFRTNRVGNLEHIETGDDDFRKWAIPVRYILHPGWVTSKSDRDRHFISEKRLIRLYGVDPRQCVSADSPSYQERPQDIHLWPSYHGDYTLPQHRKLTWQ